MKSLQGKFLSFIQKPLPAILAIGLFGFVVHYLNFRNFGLYEDDFIFTASFLDNEFQSVGQVLRYSFSSFFHGRPIGYSVQPVLSMLFATHGLWLIYLLAFSILWLNASIVYILFRSYVSPFLALLAVMVYWLYPADTTKIYLTHAFQIQLSISFALLAILIYKKYPWPAFFIAALCMMTYETAYLTFILAPLLFTRTRKGWIRFVSLFITTLAFFFILRILLGEGRVGNELSDSGLVLTAWEAFSGMFIGAFASAGLWFYNLYISLSGTSLSLAFGLLALLLILYLSLNKQHTFLQFRPINITLRKKTLNLNLIHIGFILLLISYLFSFTHYPPIAHRGRGTSVHVAAGISWIILIVGLAHYWLSRGGNIRLKKFSIVAVLLLYIPLHAQIQKSFVQEWDTTQNLWSEIIKQTGGKIPISDRSQSNVLIHNNSFDSTSYILGNSWGNTRIPMALFGADFSRAYDDCWIGGHYPSIIAQDSCWIVYPDQFDSSDITAQFELICPSNVLLVEVDQGFVKLKDSMAFAGQMIHSKIRQTMSLDSTRIMYKWLTQ